MIGDYRAGRGGKEDLANLQKELKDLCVMTLETPTSLRLRVEAGSVLLLFVVVDGWYLIAKGLVIGYL